MFGIKGSFSSAWSKLAKVSALCVVLLITGQARAVSVYAVSPDGAAVVRITPQGTVSAGSLDTSLLNAGWTATTGAGGSLSVTGYTAGFSGGTGGAEFTALYNRGNTLAAGQSLEWVQVLNTNVPLGGATSPYLDNAAKPTKPFYSYTAENRSPSLPADQLNFYDFSKRDPSSLSTTDPINWSANLYPVIWDGGTAITVLDGASWGWSMTKATVGTTSGIFVNPLPPAAVVSGVGTNTFSWGAAYPDQSWLSFVGEHFDTTPGTAFKLGQLTFHNGTIQGGTGTDSVGFDVAVNFDNVPEKNFVLSTVFGTINTPNTDDPIASADYVSLGSFPYTFNVLEGATASVDIYATLTTNLTGITGGVSSGASLFSPLDPSPDYVLTIVAIKDPSEGGFVGGVPEPATCVGFVASILGVFGYLKKRATFTAAAS